MGVHASPSRLKRELAAVSPMQSKQPTRDIADFFKPYAKPLPQPAIPRKRSSPFADRVDDKDDSASTRHGSEPVRTPLKSSPFKKATPTPRSSVIRPIYSPLSDAALPIRSPRTGKSQGVTSPKNTQRKLFDTSFTSQAGLSAGTKGGQNISFSFSDISERSQSVVKDGKVVLVLDSDDEDDDDGSDSLQSLQDILGLRDRKTRSNKDEPDLRGQNGHESQDGTERTSILSRFPQRQAAPLVGKDKIRAIYAKERNLKFDLSTILDDHFGDLEALEKISKARAESDSETGDEGDYTETDKKLLAQMVLDGASDMDSDDVNRVLNAVERTEALAGEKVFTFFGLRGMTDLRSTIEKRDFPADAIPNALWEPKDENRRSRAFLSGLLTEKAAAGELDPAALRWVFEEALREHYEDLRQSYLRVLQAGSMFWARLHVTATDVQTMFQRLGGLPDVLQDKRPIKARYHAVQEDSSQDCTQLLATLDVCEAISPHLDMATLSKLSSLLVRLSLDDVAMSNGRVCSQVESFLSSLLNLPDHDSSTHVQDRIWRDASQHISDPQLQAKLLSRIAAVGQRANKLRKMLADVFLFGPSSADLTAKSANVSLEQLHKHINASPAFMITQRQDASPNDYVQLTALVAILDVAIGVGGDAMINPRSLPLISETIPRLNSKHQVSGPLDSAIKAFNATIDDLADSIHSIFVSIKDTGASHMRRTEAKDALQALEYRLLFSVRIGVRKKKHVFDSVRSKAPKSNFNTPLSSGRGDETARSSSKRDVMKIVGMSGEDFRSKERAKAAMGRFLSGTAGSSHDIAAKTELH